MVVGLDEECKMKAHICTLYFLYKATNFCKNKRSLKVTGITFILKCSTECFFVVFYYFYPFQA